MGIDAADAKDPTLTFREKWRRHVERSELQRPLPPARILAPSHIRHRHVRLLNRWTPILLIVIYLAAAFYGLLYAMPELYEDLLTLRIMQAVGIFGLWQVMAHWYTTRSTTPFYTPEVHGTEAEVVPHIDDKLTSSSYIRIPAIGEDGDDVTFNGLKQNRHGALTASCSGATGSVSYFGGQDRWQCHNGEHHVASGDRHADLHTSPYHGESSSFATNTEHPVPKDIRYGGASTTDPHQDESQTNGNVAEALRDYWSWTRCAECQRSRPPRCHHCPVCRRCVLKRDHHCFFTGLCIGAKNQRHFIAFIFWCVFVTVFGDLHMYPYTLYHVLPRISYFDLIPFVALYRGLLGYIDFIMPILSIIFWALNVFTIFSVVFLYQSMRVIFSGLTTFEIAHKMELKDTRPLRVRLREIMGENWILNFLVPFGRKTDCHENAVSWPYIKL